MAKDQPSASIRLAERLLKALSAPVTIYDTQAELFTSIGISVYPDHGSNAETLLHRAEMALYAVKNGGKASYGTA